MLMGSEARPSLAWPVSGPERPARVLGAADVREELPWLARNGRRAQAGAVGASGALPASASRTAASAARCMALPRHGRIAGEQPQTVKLSSMAGRPVRRHMKAAAVGSKQAHVVAGSFR
jgi:hypothetical protein